MATTVLPLQPSPNDAVAMAELDRAMLHIHGDDWTDFARGARPGGVDADRGVPLASPPRVT